MVIRIFTVASAELISKPVSLVSMVRTGGRGGKDREFRVEGLGTLRGNGRGSQPTPLRSAAAPSLGSCARRLSTTLFPKAATASTGKKEKEKEEEKG